MSSRIKVDYRGSRLWDYRKHEASRMWFRTDEGQDREDMKRRALTVLRSVAYGGDGAEPSIEGPLWALHDLCSREQLHAACRWFRAAHAYTEDEEMRQVLLIEAYGWIERALRCYLS